MKYIITVVALLISMNCSAQTEEGNNDLPIELDVQLKNMHYWRGYAVTTAPLLASSLYYQSPNDQWRIGFWGGMGFDGTYREFDYFVSFQKGGFLLHSGTFTTSQLLKLQEGDFLTIAIVQQGTFWILRWPMISRRNFPLNFPPVQFYLAGIVGSQNQNRK